MSETRYVCITPDMGTGITLHDSLIYSEQYAAEFIVDKTKSDYYLYLYSISEFRKIIDLYNDSADNKVRAFEGWYKQKTSVTYNVVIYYLSSDYNKSKIIEKVSFSSKKEAVDHCASLVSDSLKDVDPQHRIEISFKLKSSAMDGINAYNSYAHSKRNMNSYLVIKGS